MNIKSLLSSYLRLRSIKKHHSRIGWRDAPKYSKYLKYSRRCIKQNIPPAGVLKDAVNEFNLQGVTSFATPSTEKLAGEMFKRLIQKEKDGLDIWSDANIEYGNKGYIGNIWNDFPEIEKLFRNDIGLFLMNYYKCYFKIFYGTLYISENVGERRGSQMWHSDSGPGICVNIMFYLDVTDSSSGVLQAIPWSQSEEIFRKEIIYFRNNNHKIKQMPKEEFRFLLDEFYNKNIQEFYENKICSPLGKSGLVVPFLNNLIHRGGYPEKGKKRYAFVFHCYPSHKKTNFEYYKNNGIAKSKPYPKNPAELF